MLLAINCCYSTLFSEVHTNQIKRLKRVTHAFIPILSQYTYPYSIKFLFLTSPIRIVYTLFTTPNINLIIFYKKQNYKKGNIILLNI